MGKINLPKLCIISPWNYPLFNPDNLTHFGGWEVRVALIARELAKRGRFQVNIVVGDHGQPHIEKRDGVTLYSWIGRTIWGIASLKKVEVGPQDLTKTFHRLAAKLSIPIEKRINKYLKRDGVSGRIGSYLITPEMISIYDEVDADIYMVPGNSQFSAEAAFYCQKRDKKFVFMSGSDFDYFPEYKLFPDQNDMYGVPHSLKLFAIENADAHIVQNERQAKLLLDGYNRTCTVIKNPIDLTPQFPRNTEAQTILWVGKSDERIKRPSIMFELVRRLPEYEFIVIMNVADRAVHERLFKEADRLPNVKYIERVPFAQIERYFASAAIHVNTSVFEGFPNTFLQAAKYGVPTISIQVDPGGMLAQFGCGLVCGGDFELLIHNVRDLMANNVLYDRLGRQSIEYVRANHNKDKIIQNYEKELLSI